MQFVHPKKLTAQLGFQEGQAVADFGAGSGHFALAIAPMVGTSGRVYAIDIQKELLERLKNASLEAGVRNVQIVWGDLEGSNGVPLADNVADIAVISNTLFQVQDKDRAIKEMKRLIKPGGKIHVIDWTESFGNMGPAVGDVVTQPQAQKLFTDAGFVLDRPFAAGEHHYGLTFINQM